MSNAVSVTEAKAKLSELVNWALDNDDMVIIENRGQPSALIVPFEYDAEIRALRERRRRQAALDRLQALAAEVQSKNSALGRAEAEQLADEVTSDAVSQLEKNGRVTLGR